MHLNWPSYATWKCYRSPLQLVSTTKHWWLYITIHSLTVFKSKMHNLRLNLIYLSFFVQYINLTFYRIRKGFHLQLNKANIICTISLAPSTFLESGGKKINICGHRYQMEPAWEQYMNKVCAKFVETFKTALDSLCQLEPTVLLQRRVKTRIGCNDVTWQIQTTSCHRPIAAKF